MHIDKVDEIERNPIFLCAIMVCLYIEATEYYSIPNYTDLENFLLRCRKYFYEKSFK